MDVNWYAATMTQDFLGLKRGEQVFYRDLRFKTPLAVGEVTVVFRTKPTKLTLRLAKSLGVHSIARSFPNNMNPRPAPPDAAAILELKYQEHTELFPAAKRVPRLTLEELTKTDTVRKKAQANMKVKK